MLKRLLFLLVQCALFSAEMDHFLHRPEQKISVQNQVLAKVNENIITVLDVMKKMDMILHQSYPQYAESTPARFQFYTNSWRSVFMEMIDIELILADAKDKEIKITEGDVREELENRFGPSVLQTLEGLRLSYEDAWKLVRDDLLRQRMIWFFIQSKAMQKVGPAAIRKAYLNHLKKHPAYSELTYRVISLSGDPQSAFEAAQTGGLEALQQIEGVQVSNEYKVKDSDLSQTLCELLLPMQPNSYSAPITSVGRNGAPSTRMYFLAAKEEHPAPSFEELSAQLKNELTQQAIAKESDLYLGKLRKHYGFDMENLKETVPQNFQPFVLL